MANIWPFFSKDAQPDELDEVVEELVETIREEVEEENAVTPQDTKAAPKVDSGEVGGGEYAKMYGRRIYKGSAMRPPKIAYTVIRPSAGGVQPAVSRRGLGNRKSHHRHGFSFSLVCTGMLYASQSRRCSRRSNSRYVVPQFRRRLQRFALRTFEVVCDCHFCFPFFIVQGSRPGLWSHHISTVLA